MAKGSRDYLGSAIEQSEMTSWSWKFVAFVGKYYTNVFGWRVLRISYLG